MSRLATPDRRSAPPWVLGALLALGVAGVWWLRAFDPAAAGSPFARCLFQAFTGWYCVGCGITRALHALVHGDIPRAFAMNPLAMLLLPLAGIATAWGLGWRAGWMQPVLRLASQPWLWIVLLPGYWVARNLPWAPFSWLAPG